MSKDSIYLEERIRYQLKGLDNIRYHIPNMVKGSNGLSKEEYIGYRIQKAFESAAFRKQINLELDIMNYKGTR